MKWFPEFSAKTHGKNQKVRNDNRRIATYCIVFNVYYNYNYELIRNGKIAQLLLMYTFWPVWWFSERQAISAQSYITKHHFDFPIM